MFRCHYHPCPYESKRESNCKQHMEKAHGWAYVRSKNNGKSGRRAAMPLEPREEESLFGSNFDWSSADPALAALPNLQLAPPATSIASHHGIDAFGAYTYADPAPPQQPTSLSPGAQGDVMLCSPYSAHDGHDAPAADEGFDEFAQGPTTRPTGDFSLYDASPAAPASQGMALFGELAAYDAPAAGWSSQGRGMHADVMEE